MKKFIIFIIFISIILFTTNVFGARWRLFRKPDLKPSPKPVPTKPITPEPEPQKEELPSRFLI